MPELLALDRADRIRASLLAGAAGDALGAPVEFHSVSDIRARYGAAGIRHFERAYGLPNAITDDTQMTLFTAEGLLDALAANASASHADLLAAIRVAYLRWLRTQSERYPGAGAARTGSLNLLGRGDLWSRRAPGNTCLSALHGGGSGTTGAPVNDSKGCGGVMRVAPVGLLAYRLGGSQRAFDLAVDAAALTHGHPSGYLSAGTFAAIIAEILDGASLLDALDRALRLLAERPNHGETSRLLERAKFLASDGPPAAHRVEALGGGWVGEEALSIAVYCALVSDDLEHGVCLAVNHGGDSDSTGAIAGNILGTLYGERAIPVRWLDGLEMADLIRTTADRIAEAISRN